MQIYFFTVTYYKQQCIKPILSICKIQQLILMDTHWLLGTYTDSKTYHPPIFCIHRVFFKRNRQETRGISWERSLSRLSIYSVCLQELKRIMETHKQHSRDWSQQKTNLLNPSHQLLTTRGMTKILLKMEHFCHRAKYIK